MNGFGGLWHDEVGMSPWRDERTRKDRATQPMDHERLRSAMKTVQLFFCVELQYLKSSLGGHHSEKKRVGHVNQKTLLKILCLFCACCRKKNISKDTTNPGIDLLCFHK